MSSETSGVGGGSWGKRWGFFLISLEPGRGQALMCTPERCLCPVEVTGDRMHCEERFHILYYTD